MPQELGDLRQACAAAVHHKGTRPPEGMGVSMFHPGPLADALQQLPQTDVGQASVRCSVRSIRVLDPQWSVRAGIRSLQLQICGQHSPGTDPSAVTRSLRPLLPHSLGDRILSVAMSKTLAHGEWRCSSWMGRVPSGLSSRCRARSVLACMLQSVSLPQAVTADEKHIAGLKPLVEMVVGAVGGN